MKSLIFCLNETQLVCIFIFKTTWESYFKNNAKIPGNLLKNLEKSWKYHGILSVQKSGNPVHKCHSEFILNKYDQCEFLVG